MKVVVQKMKAEWEVPRAETVMHWGKHSVDSVDLDPK
jgi:hypothetical protein